MASARQSGRENMIGTRDIVTENCRQIPTFIGFPSGFDVLRCGNGGRPRYSNISSPFGS